MDNKNKAKAKKILEGIFLGGGLFIGAVALFSTFYTKKEKEENQETTKKYIAVKPIAESSEIGDDVEADDCVYNVKTAELIEDYNQLDACYQNREYLSAPIEFLECLESMQDTSKNYDFGTTFPEEVKFLHLEFSVTNTGSTERNFFPYQVRIESENRHIIGDFNSRWEFLFFMAYDGQYTIMGGSDKKIELAGKKAGNSGDDWLEEKISLKPGETLKIDFVGEFLEYVWNPVSKKDKYNYDLYFSAHSIGIEDLDSRGERVRLNLVRSYEEEGIEKEAIYEEVKNIQNMKCRSWTNLELADRQKTACTYTEQEKAHEETVEAGQEYPLLLFVTKGLGGVVEKAYKHTSRLESFQIIEWKELPEEYKAQGNLQQMAQRYQSVYGCTEEELKVLLLDVVYSAEAVGDLYENGKTEILSFYENSYLYTKESEKEWKVFGMADDWRVTGNSAEPEKVGWMNMESLTVGESISVQMAYLLPPELYQKYDALYYAGGWWWDNSTYDTAVPVTKIALR